MMDSRVSREDVYRIMEEINDPEKYGLVDKPRPERKTSKKDTVPNTPVSVAPTRTPSKLPKRLEELKKHHDEQKRRDGECNEAWDRIDMTLGRICEILSNLLLLNIYCYYGAGVQVCDRQPSVRRVIWPTLYQHYYMLRLQNGVLSASGQHPCYLNYHTSSLQR
jgi:hypothetical protein